VEPPPTAIDLKKDKGLTIQWSDGTASYYTIVLLRKQSPSADQRELRDDQAKNPLSILPNNTPRGENLTALGAELVGNYALRIRFSDGHDTGIYTWDYLRGLDPSLGGPSSSKTGGPPREREE